MDPRFQTSFIPKKPIVATTNSVPSTINLFSLIATVLFVVSLALSGGVYFYKDLLGKQIEESKVFLKKAQDDIDSDFIKQAIRLDSRIETSKKLLSSHLTITPFFAFLSEITLKTVRFRDFNFSYPAPDKIAVSMKGQALSYSAVALQSDYLNQQKNLKNTIVGDMILDPGGTVSFNVITSVDPKVFSYALVASSTKKQ